MMSKPPRPTAGDPCRDLGELVVAAPSADAGCLPGVALVTVAAASGPVTQASLAG
jgi:hypothetical protein